MNEFAKASDLFSINKFEEFQVDVLNKFIRFTSDTSKVTLRRKVLAPGVGLEPTTLGTTVRCSIYWASRATGDGPCPSRTSLHFLFLVRKSLYDVIEIEEYFIVTYDFIERRLASPASCIFM